MPRFSCVLVFTCFCCFLMICILTVSQRGRDLIVFLVFEALIHFYYSTEHAPLKPSREYRRIRPFLFPSEPLFASTYIIEPQPRAITSNLLSNFVRSIAPVKLLGMECRKNSTGVLRFVDIDYWSKARSLNIGGRK